MVKSGWAMPGIDFRTKQSGKSWQAFVERKNAFNSFVGRVSSNLRLKTLFLNVLPKSQQRTWGHCFFIFLNA